MKVLFIVNIPSPYRVSFFNELGKYVDLSVAFERKNATDRNGKWSPDEDFRFDAIFLGGIKVGPDQSFSLNILKYLKKQWDVIIVGDYSTPTGIISIRYLKSKKIPFFIEADGGIIKEERLWKYRLKRFLISSASGWFSSGKATTDYLVHYGACKERCYLYPFSSVKEGDLLAIQSINADKGMLRQKLGIKEKQIVLCVAQMIYRKGIDVLIKSAEFLSDSIGIYIVGGEPTEQIKALLENDKYMPERIHFPGFKTKDELVDYYVAADIFVLPTREDIWGLVINEAMTYGLPIITTDKCVAGITLVENGKNGRIVEPDSPMSLADAINDTFSDELIKVYGYNSRCMIGNYTIEGMARAHLKHLNN